VVPPWPALESEAVCLLNSLLELDWLAGSGEQLQGGVNHRYLRLVVTMELLKYIVLECNEGGTGEGRGGVREVGDQQEEGEDGGGGEGGRHRTGSVHHGTGEHRAGGPEPATDPDQRQTETQV